MKKPHKRPVKSVGPFFYYRQRSSAYLTIAFEVHSFPEMASLVPDLNVRYTPVGRRGEALLYVSCTLAFLHDL